MGELGCVTGGLTQNSKRERLPLLMPYLRVANVYANELRLDQVSDIGVQQSEVARALLKKGDLLVVEGNGSLDQIGRVAVWNGAVDPCLHQNHIIKIRFSSAVISRFPLYWLLSAAGRDQITQVASSTSGLHTLSISKVQALRVALAPLTEQERVCEAVESYLSRLDDAIATLERVERNLKRYREAVLKSAVEGRLVPTEAALAKQEGRTYEPASVLLERILTERRRRWSDSGKKASYQEPAKPDITDLPSLPEGWCWASLESITSPTRVICYGILMPKDHVEGGVPYVKVRDMRSGTLDVLTLQRTTPEISAQFPRSILKAGDLLLAIRGTYGRVVVVPPELEGGNITQDSARLDILPGADARYVKNALLAAPIQSYFKRVARGVAVKGVNIGDVRTAPVALPPLAEQHRIIESLEDLLSVVDATRGIVLSGVARCKRLRQAVLKWAFEGKLADQDPNDEPASVLLARIKAGQSTDKLAKTVTPKRKAAKKKA